MVALIIHTGVGSQTLKKDRKMIINKFVNECGKNGLKLLNDGASAIDVVEKIINILEASGEFNAGLGSVKQSDGIQRMGASIMCSDLRCGGVAGVTNLLYPISIARKIMENTKYIYLIGEYAIKFGKENKIPMISKDISNLSENSNLNSICETIGAVALDNNGLLTAGTSTGGLRKAMAGRMGDSPIIGAGIYANQFGGVSCTGIGEDIIRTTLARYAIFQLEQGKNPQEAADLSINYFKNKTNSVAGLIILSANGEFGISHNGKYMGWKFFK